MAGYLEFEPIPSIEPGVPDFVVRVPSSLIRADKMPVLGSTYAAFQLPLSIRRNEGWTQSYIYIFSGTGGSSGQPDKSLLWEFYFTKDRGTGDAVTPFRTMIEYIRGVYWPPVLETITWGNFSAYDSSGVEYIADTNWDITLKSAYDGPTKVVTEYFASHAPFTLTAPTSMRPQGGVFYYGTGSLTLPQCLHPSFDLTFTTGTDNVRYPYQTFTKSFVATNYTNWPTTIILEDKQSYSNGLYLREKTTAYIPY